MLFISLLLGMTVYFITISVLSSREGFDDRISRRLKDIKNRTHTEDISEKLSKNIKFLIKDTEYRVAILGNILRNTALSDKIKDKLRLADVNMTIDIFLIFSLSLFLPFFLLFLVSNNSIFLILGSFMVFAPYFTLNLKIKKRGELFSQQLPETLGLISSSLRAGHSLFVAFQVVASEMPKPASSVFKIAVDDISLGINLKDALENMIRYMPDSMDLKFFATSILIQKEVGGNLAEILDKLNNTIRERFKLMGDLKAQTAQARLSGFVLALAPFLVSMIIFIFNPGYLNPLFNTPLGKLLVFYAATSALIGFVIIRKVTDIKI